MPTHPIRRFAFVGFGEVASILSEPLVQAGAEIAAADILLEQEGGLDVLQRRVRAQPVHFGSLAEVVDSADCVLSTVMTHVAEQVARDCARLLRPHQVYVDLNSTSPALKMSLSAIIAESGAAFVEGAILGAVGATGAKTEILTGGERGDEIAGILGGLGLNVRFYSREVGKASMFKMLRSVVSKGLEALLIEMLIGGQRTGIAQDLWKDITDTLTRTPFERIASNWIQSHALAHERRYHEMVQVAETLDEIGMEPVMTAATVRFFARSRSLGLSDAFPEKPASPEAVVAYLERAIGSTPS